MPFDASKEARSIIMDGPDHTRMTFGKDLGLFEHSLHHHSMFDDAGLIGLLDAFPRDALYIYTMGSDPTDHHSWRRGEGGALSGAQLLQAAKDSRLWLNMRWTNKYITGYQQLMDQMFGELRRMHPNLRTFKEDFGILISSPKVQVFYHLDIPPVTLWQIRGVKTVYLWPPEAPFAGDEDLEHSAIRDSHEILAYEPAWDRHATIIDLKPGMMVTWPQNGPHRIVNHDMLNVSLSIEYMTAATLFRANVIYGNGIMRRRWNAPQTLRDGYTPQNIAKAALARVAKKLNWHPPLMKNQPITFKVDPSAPDGLRDKIV